jgi:acetyl-CoA carboxylase biotin carboxyl carrier protein
MKEMNNTDLTKLEIEEEGIKITMEKAVPVVNVEQPVYSQPAFAPSFIPTAPVQPQVTVQQIAPAAAPAAAVADTIDKSAEDPNTKKLVSPMVGTFYSASAPDKPTFVKVGDKVKKGQTICIIEAMKLMNEIESEHDGEIVKILVNNEEMVEYGQPLFLVK